MSSALETRKHRNTPASLMFRRFDSVHVCCGRPRSPLCSATAAAARWQQKATRFDNADWRIIALATAYVIEYRYCTSQVCEIPKNSVRHHSGWFASARRLRAGSLQCIKRHRSKPARDRKRKIGKSLNLRKKILRLRTPFLKQCVQKTGPD